MTQPPAAEDLLNVIGVSKIFVTGQSLWRRGTMLRALHDVSFSVRAGETLGIVGECGSGKSTLGKIIVRLLRPNTGRVLWMGRDLTAMAREALRLVRRDLQFIFQDPQSALNPRMTVGEIIAEPLRVLRPDLKPHDRMQRALDMMAAVNLLPEQAGRFPHEFSGGQAQRIGIARALITGPQMIVCDEPVSALDLSVQAQILNLLQDVKDKLGLTLIVISHNLNVVRHISDRVLVLYLGQVMEIASVQALRDNK
jgi:oligopeptide transport system ATP-binding protein